VASGSVSAAWAHLSLASALGGGFTPGCVRSAFVIPCSCGFAFCERPEPRYQFLGRRQPLWIRGGWL
jgi:hypothetical protein